jgi:hypothetical protein
MDDDGIDICNINQIGNELADRAPIDDILRNWKLWWIPIALTLLSGLILAGGVFASVGWRDWGFLGRVGAILTVVGSFLVSRPIWRRRFKSRFVTVTMVAGNRFTPEQSAEYILERTDHWFFYVGFIVAAIGSLIWGFADLINCVDFDAAPCAIQTLRRK